MCHSSIMFIVLNITFMLLIICDWWITCCCWSWACNSCTEVDYELWADSGPAAHVAAAGSREDLYPVRRWDPHDHPSSAETHVGGGNIKWASDLFSGATVVLKAPRLEPLQDGDLSLPPLPQSGPAGSDT